MLKNETLKLMPNKKENFYIKSVIKTYSRTSQSRNDLVNEFKAKMITNFVFDQCEGFDRDC